MNVVEEIFFACHQSKLLLLLYSKYFYKRDMSMKKNTCKSISLSSLLGVALILTTSLFVSCASKPKVISSKSSKHVTVQQTAQGVYIDVHKDKSEDITDVILVDEPNGNGASVAFGNATSVNFLWPYADSGETYTIYANLYSGSKFKAEEKVTFTTEGVSKNIVDYTTDYTDSRLVLVAAKNTRTVMLKTTKEALLSILGPTTTLNAKVNVDIFSGKHAADATPNDSEYIGSFTKDLLNAADLKKLLDGYDIISLAGSFGYTPSELNKKLSSNKTYFARACVIYNLTDKDNAAVKYMTKYIYTNDTIYTPIAESDLPAPVITTNDSAK